jgi:hypothetical protein
MLCWLSCRHPNRLTRACVCAAQITLQYLACVCDIAACISGSSEIAELANLIDCLADITWCTCAPTTVALLL